jgi:DNA-binding Lrp family transcriptional regulator
MIELRKPLFEKTGDTIEALLLFFLAKKCEKAKPISAKQIKKDCLLSISEQTIRRKIKSLKNKGLIKEYDSGLQNRTKIYKVEEEIMEILSVIDIETGEVSDETFERVDDDILKNSYVNKPIVNIIMEKYKKLCRVANPAKERRAAKKLAKRYSVGQIFDVYEYIKQQEFWKDKHLSLVVINREIDQVLKSDKFRQVMSSNISSEDIERNLDQINKYVSFYLKTTGHEISQDVFNKAAEIITQIIIDKKTEDLYKATKKYFRYISKRKKNPKNIVEFLGNWSRWK